MQKIIFIRLSAIGDIVMASPIIGAARKQFPDAHLTWLTQPECASLIYDHPDIDEVITWPRQKWQTLFKDKKYWQLWLEFKQFRQLLRAKRFDLAIDLQGLLKSGFLTLLTSARQRIGLGSKEGSQFLMHNVIPRDQGDTEMIGSEYRYLIKKLGWPEHSLNMKVGISRTSELSASEIIKSALGSNHYAVICPFTTRPQKHWFDDYWIELSEQIKKETGLSIVLLGGPGDTNHADHLAQSTDIINLSGQTSLQEAAEIIRHSHCVVGVDTGLTHIAHSFQVPTVALFGSTCPYLKTDSYFSKVIYHNLSCSPCKRQPTCNGAYTCLRDINPKEVMNTLLNLLKTKASSPLAFNNA